MTMAIGAAVDRAMALGGDQSIKVFHIRISPLRIAGQDIGDIGHAAVSQPRSGLHEQQHVRGGAALPPAVAAWMGEAELGTLPDVAAVEPPFREGDGRDGVSMVGVMASVLCVGKADTSSLRLSGRVPGFIAETPRVLGGNP